MLLLAQPTHTRFPMGFVALPAPTTNPPVAKKKKPTKKPLNTMLVPALVTVTPAVPTACLEQTTGPLVGEGKMEDEKLRQI